MASQILIIVDMQKYYLSRDSDYCRYFEAIHPGCLGYLFTRCSGTVIPNIQRIASSHRDCGMPVVYLRLCGTRKDRSDLHRFFRETYESGVEMGFENTYPLASDHFASVADELVPQKGDMVFDKTTFSPFTCTDIDCVLREMGVTTCVFAGLATSQCVETSARDASDRGYSVILIEDAQADYDETTHHASLFSSRGVCGGMILSTEEYIRDMDYS